MVWQIGRTGTTVFEQLAYNITYHWHTVQYWVPSPDSLTTTHTWAHLAWATYMKASLVNNPQVAQTTLKLRAHTFP